ncbi:MAG: hypothetical protein ACN2B6_12145 [Rickettsiales bacterium]
MSVMLYQKGSSHTIVRGDDEIKCTARVFKTKHLQAAIKAGWCLDPKNITSKPGRKAQDPDPQPKAAAPVVEAGEPDAAQG